MKSKVIRFARNLGGVLLLLLGVVGLFLPFLQGILFIVLGLGLIDLPIKRRAHAWARQRWRCYRKIALHHQRFARRLRQRGRERRRSERR